MRAELLRNHARAHAAVLTTDLPRPVEIAVVACSYDTDFEPVAEQVLSKINEITDIFGPTEGPWGAVRWSIWIVDDLPEDAHFADAVRAGFAAAPATLLTEDRLHCVPLTGGPRQPGGLKGRALLDGMQAAMSWKPDLDAVVYVNLNLKVNAQHMATGLRALLLDDVCDAAMGTRAPAHGGAVVGAGTLGRFKSKVYSRLARTLLPPLASHLDTNAPMKIFGNAAAHHLVSKARIDQVTMDCEWLMILNQGPFRVAQFPVAWIQRPGSHPPWGMIGLGVADLWRIRRRWRQGDLV
ncbi:MAG: hypothetical protein ACE366_02525 [Bradymonadia bacterium]